VTSQVVWLNAGRVDPGEVGDRAAILARLAASGIPVPRAFVLGRALFLVFLAEARRADALHIPAKLPAALLRDITDALPGLGGSFAIRRSPLEGAREDSSWMTKTLGGRPERETYLHLTDPAEVGEAVRRIWGTGLSSAQSSSPIAIMVQRFMLPEVCAIVRRDRKDAEQLRVASTLGIGDLLAAGLVVPDLHTLRRGDGKVVHCSLGRKAQMSVPQRDGGVARVPVPPSAARRAAIDDGRLGDLHATWRAAEEAVPGLEAIAASWTAGRWYVTSAVGPVGVVQDEVLLG
jgi:rifampicin phosphotransferase